MPRSKKCWKVWKKKADRVEKKTNLSSQEMDDLKGVLNDANSKELLTVVATVHHERVGQTLNDGALSLAEALLVVASSSVGQILLVLGGVLNSEIILQAATETVSNGNEKSCQIFQVALGGRKMIVGSS